MFIPLHDINPLRSIRFPFVTYAVMFLCTANFLVFQSGLVVDAAYGSAVSFGVIPLELFQHLGLGNTLAIAQEPLALVPEPLTLFTYTFMHGGWMHLIGNLLFLWVFADNVEDDLGHTRFAVFYLLCGAGGAIAHAASAPASTVPLVGASGAIAGVVAAYVIFHPSAKVWVLLLGRLPLKLSAVWAVAGWLVFQIASVALLDDKYTAWWAHIGGFATGAVLTPMLRRRDEPLVDRNLPA